MNDKYLLVSQILNEAAIRLTNVVKGTQGAIGIAKRNAAAKAARAARAMRRFQPQPQPQKWGWGKKLAVGAGATTAAAGLAGYGAYKGTVGAAKGAHRIGRAIVTGE